VGSRIAMIDGSWIYAIMIGMARGWMDQMCFLLLFPFYIDNEAHHCLKQDISIRKTLVFSPFSLSRFVVIHCCCLLP
jgi:hypothetical protein